MLELQIVAVQSKAMISQACLRGTVHVFEVCGRREALTKLVLGPTPAMYTLSHAVSSMSQPSTFKPRSDYSAGVTLQCRSGGCNVHIVVEYIYLYVTEGGWRAFSSVVRISQKLTAGWVTDLLE